MLSSPFITELQMYQRVHSNVVPFVYACMWGVRAVCVRDVCACGVVFAVCIQHTALLFGIEVQ